MSLRVYDTLTAEKREFQPLIPGKVRMYACGVTPYDRSHIGHARSAIAYDIIYRYLKFTGLEVTFVRNFTDVDDKIIQRANERGVSAMDLADEFIKAYHEDMDALGLLRPDSEPRVSTTIPQIIALTERLVERGVAYASEGDVYFAVILAADIPTGTTVRFKVENCRRGSCPTAGGELVGDDALVAYTVTITP